MTTRDEKQTWSHDDCGSIVLNLGLSKVVVFRGWPSQLGFNLTRWQKNRQRQSADFMHFSGLSHCVRPARSHASSLEGDVQLSNRN